MVSIKNVRRGFTAVLTVGPLVAALYLTSPAEAHGKKTPTPQPTESPAVEITPTPYLATAEHDSGDDDEDDDDGTATPFPATATPEPHTATPFPTERPTETQPPATDTPFPSLTPTPTPRHGNVFDTWKGACEGGIVYQERDPRVFDIILSAPSVGAVHPDGGLPFYVGVPGDAVSVYFNPGQDYDGDGDINDVKVVLSSTIRNETHVSDLEGFLGEAATLRFFYDQVRGEDDDRVFAQKVDTKSCPLPTPTPETPTAAPVTSTPTPETPTATPVTSTPTPAPVTSTPTPETPTATPTPDDSPTPDFSATPTPDDSPTPDFSATPTPTNTSIPEPTDGPPSPTPTAQLPGDELTSAGGGAIEGDRRGLSTALMAAGGLAALVSGAYLAASRRRAGPNAPPEPPTGYLPALANGEGYRAYLARAQSGNAQGIVDLLKGSAPGMWRWEKRLQALQSEDLGSLAASDRTILSGVIERNRYLKRAKPEMYTAIRSLFGEGDA